MARRRSWRDCGVSTGWLMKYTGRVARDPEGMGALLYGWRCSPWLGNFGPRPPVMHFFTQGVRYSVGSADQARPASGGHRPRHCDERSATNTTQSDFAAPKTRQKL